MSRSSRNHPYVTNSLHLAESLIHMPQSPCNAFIYHELCIHRLLALCVAPHAPTAPYGVTHPRVCHKLLATHSYFTNSAATFCSHNMSHRVRPQHTAKSPIHMSRTPCNSFICHEQCSYILRPHNMLHCVRSHYTAESLIHMSQTHSSYVCH